MYALRDLYTLENLDFMNREIELQSEITSLKDLYTSNKKENDVLRNKIKELENQILDQKGSSDNLSNLLKDTNNLYKIKSKENDELINKINELENLKDQLENQNLKINDLDAQNKLLKSRRDEFRKLYDTKIKKMKFKN